MKPSPTAALLRAFWRGRDAAADGQPISANPYRRFGLRRRPRRGSWSESFSAAWARGWHAETERRAAPAPGGSGHYEAHTTT